MKDYKRLTDRVIAEMLRNTEEESWDSDNIEAQCYIRLAELEDKIERGELVEVPKGAVVLSPEERKEKKRLAAEERKRAVDNGGQDRRACKGGVRRMKAVLMSVQPKRVERMEVCRWIE